MSLTKYTVLKVKYINKLNQMNLTKYTVTSSGTN